MPFDRSWGNCSGKLILVLLTTFIIQMNFVGSRDGNGGVNRHIRNRDSDNLFIIALKLTDLCFREKAHANLNTQKYTYKGNSNLLS